MKSAILAAGLFLAPTAWFTSLEANFALAQWACTGHGKSILLLVSLAALIFAVTGGLLSWTQRNYNRRLALGGAAMSALFAIVIAAQAIPNLMLGGCE